MMTIMVVMMTMVVVMMMMSNVAPLNALVSRALRAVKRSSSSSSMRML
jgi:hypothetical protein